MDGTCDELGRVGSWIDVAASGPLRFTIGLRLAGLEAPSVVAERLPKALIHRNVPGERVHELLMALDAAWVRASPLSVYGPEQRFVAAAEAPEGAGRPGAGLPCALAAGRADRAVEHGRPAPLTPFDSRLLGTSAVGARAAHARGQPQIPLRAGS